MKNIASNVFNSLSSVINALGYELYDVEYAKKQNGMNLTLYIQNKNDQPITLQDCEKVHHVVDKVLDEINPTNDKPYYLNVSSIGIDRPLKIDKDFNRCLNKMVEVKLFTLFFGKKDFVGKLISFDSNNITLQIGNEVLTFLRKDIALCKLYVEF